MGLSCIYDALKKEYLPEYSLPQDLEPFPIGCFGDGSTAILDKTTGKVLMLLHDCMEDVPIEDVEASFFGLLKRQAQFVVDIAEWI